jgi:hypothetical protein
VSRHGGMVEPLGRLRQGAIVGIGSGGKEEGGDKCRVRSEKEESEGLKV